MLATVPSLAAGASPRCAAARAFVPRRLATVARLCGALHAASATPSPSGRYAVSLASPSWRPTGARGRPAAASPSSSSPGPNAPPAAAAQQPTLPALRAALELAVEEEDYTEAARLRDAMK